MFFLTKFVSFLDMSGNSLSTNGSIPDAHFFFVGSLYPEYLSCYTSEPSSSIFSSFLITNICLCLPLSVFIMHHGHQQWQQMGSSSSAMSHSDCFIYHMVTMELISVLGCSVSCCGVYMKDLNMLAVGSYLVGFNWVGGILFHVLTCLERYLAVVHPITYLHLRSERGVRIRNVAIGCVWMFCCLGLVLAAFQVFTKVEICLLVVSLSTVSFCSVSVLWVLIHPSPGEKNKRKESIHQSKQKASNTIAAILGVLLVKFVFNIIWQVLVLTQGTNTCVILACCSWFNVPSNLVLPLLFLNRAGKFMCFKKIFKWRPEVKYPTSATRQQIKEDEGKTKE